MVVRGVAKMKQIEVKVLNPEAVQEASKMMVCSARLTQSGHKIKNMDDFVELYNKPYKEETKEIMSNLSHNTIKRFSTINVVITGASRRFLAQITRHQVGITFMSASLQYSDYSGEADFCVPYSILEKGEPYIKQYLNSCKMSMDIYKATVSDGIDNDAAGYMAPQGLRNVLIISANPLAWMQMISTRVCRRNTKETQYVMLKIWEELYKLDPILFSCKNCGPRCCNEGKFSCGKPCNKLTPTEILKEDFKLLYED